MSEIEPYRPRDIVSHIPEAAQGLVEWAQSASAAYELASRLITTSFAPAQYKGKPDEAAAAMLAGAEVGLSPMASLRSFDVIQGAAAPRAITLRAIVQSLGHEMVIDESTPAKCVGRGKRKGSTEWQRVEWTIDRATKLGLTGKDQWKKQPQTMLIARVTSELARLIAADAILGIPYTAEELTDEATPTTTVTRETKPRTSMKRATAPEPEEPAFEPPVDVEPPAAPPSDLITKQQMSLLHILLNKEGLADRDAGLAYISETLGTPVTSTKELTKSQASRLIDTMREPPAPVVDESAEPSFDEPEGWGQS